MWEIINDIFVAGGIVTFLFGGSLLGLIVWITRKPRVFVLSEPKAYWFYTYKDGRDYSQVNILMLAEVVNKGKENTIISACFETTEGNYYVFNTAKEDEIKLEQNKSANRVLLHSPFENKYPEGYRLTGVLKLRPTGNRRLLLFGKQYITIKLSIPENQAMIFQSVTYGN